MISFHWLFLLLLTLIYLIIVFALAARLLLDNRSPSNTLAWLMVLGGLPVVGLILYIFFGRNYRKEKYISSQSLDQISKRSLYGYVEQRNLVIPEEHAELIRLFSNQNVALPFKDNEIEIYENGHEFFPALLKAIAQAKNHIHLVVYIFENDALGTLISDALIDKALQGVEVRVIYDYVGCWHVPSEFYERMREAGIDVHAFMPVKFPAFTSKVNYRNHRKLCVIDGEVGFIGGMNIATRYVKGKTDTPWRDTHMRIIGSAVYGIQTAFLVDWYFVDRSLVSGPAYYPENTFKINNNCLAQIVTSNPTSQWPEIMHGYVRILMEAKKYVYIETPYFLPTDPVLFAIRTSVLAGVDVRLVVPEHSDTRMVEWAGRSFIREALEAGVKVYLYKEGFNHSKLLVCDDTLCSCGSTNVDFRSFENNFEANVFVYDSDIVARMKAIIERDMERSQLIDAKSYRSRIRVRLFESIVRLFSPLL